MKPDRWLQVEELFQGALACAPDSRAEFLERSCPDDAALRQEVEKLLVSFDNAASFLEQPAVESFGLRGSPAPMSPNLTAGQQLAHFEIISLLGEGGMGEVYLARDTKLDRRIALKILPAQFSANPEGVARFEREARAASGLNHPNIITIHEIGEEDGKHFIATEYIKGETLRQRLNKGRLSQHEAVEIGRQVASALAAAHQAGLIHRDIKPENVMIWPDGLVKILDFGLAKPVHENYEEPAIAATRTASLDTDPDLLIGSLNYLSPEQVRREKLDPRTDIFSLGVVLYEMLEGTRPFTGATAAEVCAAIVGSASPQLDRSALSQIVKRALSKERDLRYQSAGALQADLSALTPQTDTASLGWKSIAAGALIMIVVLLALSFWILEGRRSVSPSGPVFNSQSRQKLTDLTGQELFPSLAPDGQTFIFASYRSGNWDIYRQMVGGREAVNLTTDSTSYDNQPVFSPDGSRIAFCSSRSGNGVYVMNGDGSHVSKLTEGGNNPAWSPDGREIVFSDERTWDHEGRPTYPGSSRLWIVDVETRQLRLLTSHDGVQPSWSPDGKRIAFWGDRTNRRQRDIWTVAASGGEPVPVTDDAAIDWNPVFSPDGKHLYFLSNRNGSMNLWRVALDESGVVMSAPEAVLPSENHQHVCLSRDGHSLIYVQTSRSENLWQIAFDPVTVRVIGDAKPVTQGLKRYSMFSLSPDEQSFVYVGLGEPQSDLFISDLDGNPVRRLTDDIAADNVPRWSPNGQYIAFLSDRSGKREIWRVRQDGSELTQMTDVSDQEVIDPVWSPDSKRLLYQIRNVNSFIINADQPSTLESTQQLEGQAPPGFLVWNWSANAAFLAGWLPGLGKPNQGIVVYSFERQTYERLTDFGEFPIWLNDNRRLLFIWGKELYSLDRLSGTTGPILSISPGDFGLFALSRDNRRLYFTRKSNEADIWLLKLG
jgi:eukaryotic-like serine/threonine-protein kinase